MALSDFVSYLSLYRRNLILTVERTNAHLQIQTHAHLRRLAHKHAVFRFPATERLSPLSPQVHRVLRAQEAAMQRLILTAPALRGWGLVSADPESDSESAAAAAE